MRRGPAGVTALLLASSLSLAGCSTGGGHRAPQAAGAGSAAPAAATPASATPTATPRATARPRRPAPPSRSPSPTPRRSPSAPSSPAALGAGLHYVYPVTGCSSSPSSSHHDYPAADIFTQKGCRFVAVVSGRVDEVSYHDRWSPSNDSGAVRGGLSVSIVGVDGVRYYGSHLLRIAAGIRPGARVRAGQLLGLIDNSGDARYTPTHVHFGISWPTRPGVWWVRRGMVWPQRYLAAWRAHRNLSPAPEVRRLHARDGDVPPCSAEC